MRVCSSAREETASNVTGGAGQHGSEATTMLHRSRFARKSGLKPIRPQAALLVSGRVSFKLVSRCLSWGLSVFTSDCFLFSY